jgi:phosphate transport system permease protein
MSDKSPIADVPSRSTEQRTLLNQCFKLACIVVATSSVVVLFGLLASILAQGIPHLSWTLLTSGPEPVAAEAGMSSAIFGTLWVCSLCAVVTLPIGVATAILLEEYQPRNRIGRFLYGVIQLNISNLAGVPSVVYGILGLTAFVSMFGFFQSTNGRASYEIGVQYYDQFFDGERSILIPVDSPDASPTVLKSGMRAYSASLEPVDLSVFEPGDVVPKTTETVYAMSSDSEPGRLTKKSWYYFSLPFGRGVLTGALTLMLVVLPVVIISSQESLRAVPPSLRDGALGLGATPWQVVWNVTLPAAIPGVMTGSILAMSRAIGETAPILIISGIVSISRSPQHLMDEFTVMPLQIYNWISRANSEFHGIAAAGIILLLATLLSFNAVAVLIRHKLQKPLS